MHINLSTESDQAQEAIKKAIDEEGWEPVVQEVMRQLHVSTFVEAPEVEQLGNELRAAEGKVTRLTELLVQRPTSDALLSALDEAEERVRSLKAALRSKRLLPGSVPRVRPGEVERAFRELATVEGQDRAVANTTLRAYLGRVIMTPQSEGPERGYRASGAIDIFVPLTRGRENVSCGGVMVDFSPPRIPFDAWVPCPGRAA